MIRFLLNHDFFNDTRYRRPLLGACSCRPSVSPEPSNSAARKTLLILWLSPRNYSCRERQNSLFVLESYVVSLAICAARWLVYDVLFLCLFLKTFFCKKLENVSCEYDQWVVESQLCKLRDTSDTLVGRACAMFPL